MLSLEGRRPNGLWTKGVYFGDGNATVQVVLETVDDGDADEPNSTVKVEVMPYPLYPGNPENEDLYSVHGSRGSATATVTASGASSSQRSLQGRFVSPPQRHDGEKRIKVWVAFSEPVAESPRNVGEHGVDVEGGEVTSVRPVVGNGNVPGGAGTRKGTRSTGGRNAGQEDREVVWEFEIEPDSDGDVTVTLDAGRPCDEEGAICTADGRSLSEGISTTVEGPEEGPPPLTASFEAMPGEHDGESAFTFRLAFSEPLSWMNGRRLREDVVAVTGGRATAAGRVDRRRDLWQVTVEPDSPADATVTLEAGAACGTPAAVCTKDGRALSATISATVAGPAVETAVVPLTASFEAVPGEHDGESAFRFRVAFSEPIAISYRSLREDAFAVTGGRVTRGKRVDGRKDLFEITVEPEGAGDVAVSLPAGRECEVSGRDLHLGTAAQAIDQHAFDDGGGSGRGAGEHAGGGRAGDRR